MTLREYAQILDHSIWGLELALDEFDTGHALDRQRTEEQLKELRRLRREETSNGTTINNTNSEAR